MPFQILEGVRVVELATEVAGPFCGKLLAEYGAEVVKVEPKAGDPSRLRGPFPGDKPHPEKSALFLHLNVNKKSVTLDLEEPSDRALFQKLIEGSHVLIESGKPGKLDSLGLGYEDLRRVRPDLVMTSVTPFGQTGPHRDHEFTELTVFATGGAMYREGVPDREPLRYGGETAQYFAGTAAAAVTMAACLKSASTGLGEWIDLSIQECMAGHPHQIGRRAPFAYAGELDPRREPHAPFAGFGGREAYGVGTFRCKDGYVSFLPLGPRMWPGFAAMIGRPDLPEDPRFIRPEHRLERHGELAAMFQEWLDRHSRAQVFAAGQEAGLPCGPVLTVDEAMADRHFGDRDYFAEVHHPDAGPLRYPGPPFRLSNADRSPPRPAPRLGRHNGEVLGATQEKVPPRAGKRPRSSAPLAGVRVLELGEIWAGPFCGELLGDLGAEVISIESIQRIYRGEVRPRPGTLGYADGEPGERPWNRWANYNALNRNKLGATLDLASADGAAVFWDLVATSDVVFSNYAFGVMDSFGLGYDALRKERPDLVMLLMPGFGNTGPYRRYRSMGMTIDAISGHSALRGYPDTDLSQLPTVHHPDAVAGVMAAFAVCVALHHRARTGVGQLIDISQAEAFMTHLGEFFLGHGMNGRSGERWGNRNASMAPHGCYPALGEDRWVTIAVKDDARWEAFCEVTGIPPKPELSTLEGRLRNRDELDALVAGWTSGLDRYESTRLLQARGIAAAPVLDCGADAYDDPHLQERGYFQEATHPEAGTFLLSGPLWKLHGASAPAQTPAPCLGQHNGYALGEILGYSKSALDTLEARQVIGTVPLEGSDMGGVRRSKQAAATR